MKHRNTLGKKIGNSYKQVGNDSRGVPHGELPSGCSQKLAWTRYWMATTQEGDSVPDTGQLELAGGVADRGSLARRGFGRRRIFFAPEDAIDDHLFLLAAIAELMRPADGLELVAAEQTQQLLEARAPRGREAVDELVLRPAVGDRQLEAVGELDQASLGEGVESGALIDARHERRG